MSNEKLSHELLLDSTFQLDEGGGCSAENPVFHSIRQTFHHAFWDSLVCNLRLDTPCYVRVLRVLTEIQDGIYNLAAGTKGPKNDNIVEVVDVDYILQQAEKGLYDWSNCKSLIEAIFTIIHQVASRKC